LSFADEGSRATVQLQGYALEFLKNFTHPQASVYTEGVGFTLLYDENARGGI